MECFFKFLPRHITVRLSKNLLNNQSLWMGPSEDERALIGGSEYVFQNPSKWGIKSTTKAA